MSEVLWCARHLYSLETGEMLSKEDGAAWYLGLYPSGALAEALKLVLRWRESGEAPGDEVVRVARLVQPATAEFLVRAAGVEGEELPTLIQAAQERLR